MRFSRPPEAASAPAPASAPAKASAHRAAALVRGGAGVPGLSRLVVAIQGVTGRRGIARPLLRDPVATRARPVSRLVAVIHVAVLPGVYVPFLAADHEAAPLLAAVAHTGGPAGGPEAARCPLGVRHTSAPRPVGA